MSENFRKLTYYFVGQGVPPSLDPEASDNIRNMVHMDHLVGTLLKERYGNSGRTEPYLAERWNIESDGLIWNFYLKAGLTCEDGTKINAAAFVQSFNRILRLYAKRDELAAFNRLKGWQTFRTSNTPLEGIRAVSDLHLQFHFDSAPDGFPEFLAMSFYGFYCEANFSDGRWKDHKKIVASGPYSLQPDSITDHQITLRKRDDFALSVPGSPVKVTIRSIDAKDAAKVPARDSMLYYRQSLGDNRPDGFTLFQGAPIFLTALALSPYRDSPLSRPEVRKAFRSTVRRLMQQMPPPDVGDAKLYRAPRFYFSDGAQTKNTEVDVKIPKIHFERPLQVLRFAYSARNQNQYAEEIVKHALDELGWPYELHDPNFKDPDFIRKRNTNRLFDIRFATVDIGGSAENWVVNMMFCSQLAISFPDPSGRICKLVKEHEGRSGQYNQAEYNNRFEDIVEDDATVVPLYHTGAYWLMSPDLALEGVLAPTMVVPRFDKLRFK